MLLKSRIAIAGALIQALFNKPVRNTLFRVIKAEKSLPPAECPCCAYIGKFQSAGMDVRLGQRCPSCQSYERHRLVALAFQARFLNLTNKDVLHFAPEQAIRPLVLKEKPRSYVTADIEPGRADRVLNLEDIDLPDGSFDIAIASHVLEHVDDRKALSELKRILRPGGQLIAMVPLIEGWDQTYEDPEKTSLQDRQAYFGRYDHVRYYGADFRDRIRQAGFELTEFTAGPTDSVSYRLTRGEKVFLATKI